jgi:predicted membrane protein
MVLKIILLLIVIPIGLLLSCFIAIMLFGSNERFQQWKRWQQYFSATFIGAIILYYIFKIIMSLPHRD